MKKTLSTSEAARLLGVAVGSVANWIDQGQLKAGRTPGGHRRVTVPDFLDFLRRQKLPIPPGLNAATATVLIVDDDQTVARWLAAEIKAEHEDYDVLEANDGFAAGELVISRRPDAVVLDLRMPGMDGFEVCRRIKAREETKDIAVIAMTAYLSDEVNERIRQCGERVCLGKPLEIATLMKELDQALEGRA